MRIEFTKEERFDRICVQRGDGSRISTTFPKKGWFPHDAVHLVVERCLGLRSAFWGQIARGVSPEELGALAKVAGHASAKRANQPDEGLIELLQSERLVECFEAELWSEPARFEIFSDVLSAACEQSSIPVPDITEQDIDAIRAQLDALADQWRSLPIGETMELRWEAVPDQ